MLERNVSEIKNHDSIELKDLKSSSTILTQDIKQILEKYKQKRVLIKAVGARLPYSKEMTRVVHFYDNLTDKSHTLSKQELVNLIEIISKTSTQADADTQTAFQALKEKISFSLWPAFEKISKYPHSQKDLQFMYENPQHAVKIANSIALLNTKNCIHCVNPKLKELIYQYPDHAENIINAHLLLNKHKIPENNILVLCSTYPDNITEISKAYLTLWKLKVKELVIHNLLKKYNKNLYEITCQIENIIKIFNVASASNASKVLIKFIEENASIESSILQLQTAMNLLRENNLLDDSFIEDVIHIMLTHLDRSHEIAEAFVKLNNHDMGSCQACFDFTFKNLDKAKPIASIILLLTKSYLISHPLTLNFLYQTEKFLDQNTVEIFEKLFETTLLSYDNFVNLMKQAQYFNDILKLLQTEASLNQEKLDVIFSSVASSKNLRLKFFDSKETGQESKEEDKKIESTQKLSLS